jgi:hypothetical protein
MRSTLQDEVSSLEANVDRHELVEEGARLRTLEEGGEHGFQVALFVDLFEQLG